MKKVVSLATFCCMVLNLGIVSDAEAARNYNQLRLETLEKDPSVQEYFEAREDPNLREYFEIIKKPSVREYFQRRKAPKVKEYLELKKKTWKNSRDNEQSSNVIGKRSNTESDYENGSDNSISNNSSRKRRRSQSTQNYNGDSDSGYESNINTYNTDSENGSTSSGQTSKNNRKRRKINRNQSNQPNMMDQNNVTNESQNSVQTSNTRKKRRKKNRNQSNRVNMMNQNDQTDTMNGSQNSVQTSNTRKKRRKKNRNQSNRINMMNQMRQIDSNNEFVLNEPIIDDTKIKKSSIVVEKNIKLASNNESKNIEKKISPIESYPSEKEKVFAQTNSVKETKLIANLDDSKKEIKEKLLQVNNRRKTYNLIRTPDRKLKNNFQVSKFREELDYYRKLYSANLKKA